MGFKTLAVSTGRGFKTLAVAAADTTKEALTPAKGDRKVRLTLLMVLPMLLGIGILVFFYKEAVVDLVKIASDLVFKALGVFGLANTGEHIANGFGGKAGSGDDSPPPAKKPSNFMP